MRHQTTLAKKPTVIITFHHTLDGNDLKGDGSLERPFRTGRRAVYAIPPMLAAGAIYVVTPAPRPWDETPEEMAMANEAIVELKNEGRR